MVPAAGTGVFREFTFPWLSAKWRFLAIAVSFLPVAFPPIQAQEARFEIEEVPQTRQLQSFMGSCLLQDSEGFVWFGSDDGIYRYDGTGFLVFRSGADEGSLPNHKAHHIIEDSEGFLWIATSGGLHRLNKHTGIFTSYYSPSGRKTKDLHNFVRCLHEDRMENLWIGTRAGIGRFDRGSGTFRHYVIHQPDSLNVPAFNEIFRLYEDRKGTLWLQNGHNALSKYLPDADSFVFVTAFGCGLKAMLEDRSGRFWITTNCGLYEFDRNNLTFTRRLFQPDDPGRLQHEIVRAIIEDRDQRIWIRTFDGLYAFNQKLEQLFYWKHPEEYLAVAPDFAATAYLCEDRSGTIWFFTRSGISKVIEVSNTFTIYDPVPERNTYVKDIWVENDSSIWFASLSGLYHLRRPDRYTHYTLSDEPYMDRSVNPNGIEQILMDSRRTMWIGSSEMGIYRMTCQAKDSCTIEKLYSDEYDTRTVSTRTVTQFFEDSRGRIWISTVDHPPCFYDPDSHKIYHLAPPITGRTNLTNYRVRHETAEGHLLAIGQFGIVTIRGPVARSSPDSVRATDISHLPVSANTTEFYTKRDISTSYLDSEETLWLGIQGSGLVKLCETASGNDKNLYEIQVYTSDNGLPSNVVTSITEDANGFLWIGTSNGLARFDPRWELFSNYLTREIIPSNEFRRNCVTRSDKGELFFGTSNGLLQFHPDSITRDQFMPPVVLTKLEINQMPASQVEGLNLTRPLHLEEVELRHYQKNLSLEFAALSYVHPHMNQYMYKLDGFDEKWIFSGERNYAAYTNLKPGHYVFRVRGSSSYGVWNEEGAALSIDIRPSPLVTWWAFTIYAFLLLLIILQIRRYELNKAKLRADLKIERMQKEQSQELELLKSRFFANVSHEFRTPLTLLLGPLEDLAGKSGQSNRQREVFSIMLRNARRLQNLINQLLNVSKFQTSEARLRVTPGDLEEFIRTIVQSFISLAESRQIRYSYHIPEIGYEVFFDEDKIEKIVNNLISNAMKFTPPEGEVKVNLHYGCDRESEIPRFAEIEVADTGKGIPGEKLDRIFDRFYQASERDIYETEGTGLGLTLVKEIIKLYRGEIHVKSEPGKGTVFTVRIPVASDLFGEEEIVSSAQTRSPAEGIKHESFVQNPEDDSEPASVLPGFETGETERVLIVEDNRDLRTYIARSLDGDYEIMTAANGNSGLTQAMEYIPDLVISDVMMMEMDGIELCRRLKQDDRTSHIPVILLTARADKESRMEGLETGADDYIIKPFDAEELNVRVANLVGQRRKLREVFRKEFIEGYGNNQSNPGDTFRERLLIILYRHLSDPDYKTEQLTDALHLSRSQLYRKVMAITGFSPKELLRNLRLKKAAHLFRSGEDHVAKVMYQVGFNNQSYFSKCFRGLYGMNPSEYIQSNGK